MLSGLFLPEQAEQLSTRQPTDHFDESLGFQHRSAAASSLVINGPPSAVSFCPTVYGSLHLFVNNKARSSRSRALRARGWLVGAPFSTSVVCAASLPPVRSHRSSRIRWGRRDSLAARQKFYF